jgi:hypothetical protein
MHSKKNKHKNDITLLLENSEVSVNTDCHDITEILLKVALNTIKQTNNFLD